MEDNFLKIINKVRIGVFGILVVIEVLIFLAIWISLEGELSTYFTIGIILVPVLMWLGNKK